MFLFALSMVHSQWFLFVLHLLGLTEEETKHCVRIETKKRVLFVKKTKVEHRCTTNKLSEKHEGNSTLLAAYPVCPEPSCHLQTILDVTVLFLAFHLFNFSASEPCVLGQGIQIKYH